ncbi:hypothetical protein COU15_03010 [Candidatus Kaiserbacteria bacterium CG10_big_fil_rev_8_21_14_0_10_45_20]|uniref:SIMPL domain-containing protein n=1 Tax=Candidatus Kaiserbacteria bacterium CG10_big_fil_rev_8_21_14_0_10_45_20 TaxID=1974607 RepID=A0A2H0UF35_9BACT|nr:MAG: hypothetical protein COU15_03010 [Candidatus Kaiserbacteria bacterium CG10_big_fil_rev_8_21_14_0_10_45_20]
MEENKTKLFESPRIEKLASLFLIVAVVLVGAQAVSALGDVFAPRPAMGNMISVEGEGRVTAVPDIATVSFTVSEESQTVAQAQDVATKKTNTALSLLKDDIGIEDEYIKTTSYNVTPRYSYTQCYDRVCPPSEERIIGYTVSQTIQVKIRDIEKVGETLAALGGVGVSNLHGPSFEVDDIERLRKEAREQAIQNAREQAKTLAKSLGVGIVRVTGFWENNDPYYPYYREGLGGDAMVTSQSKTPPSVPTGENEIVVRVSVSYEIR